MRSTHLDDRGTIVAPASDVTVGLATGAMCRGESDIFSKSGISPVNSRRFLAVGLSVFLVVLISAAVSLILIEMESTRLAQDATLIDQSSRQRMLSQRIVYLAQDMAQNSETPDQVSAASIRADLASAIDQFEAAIVLFEADYAAFSAGGDAALQAPGAHSDAASEPSLRARARTYVDVARSLMAEPTSSSLLQHLKEIERGGILADLDRATQNFRTASDAQIAASRSIERFTLFTAVLFVVIVVAFVFLPGHRAIVRTIDANNLPSHALNDGRLAPKESNADLLAQIDEMASEQSGIVAALEESEQQRAEQSEFTYAVSHDLKSPAGTIQLLLNELRIDHYDMLDEDGKEMFDSAQGTAQRMLDLIDDVLVYSWATDEDGHPENFDMRACLQDVVADLSSEIRVAGARILLGGELFVTGYRTQLRILAQNLIANAIKFRNPGTIPDISVNCLPGDTAGTWRLIVQDNGIGIPKEHQSRIFKLFQRLHVREVYPGSGLGLATCQRIVANHLGKITLHSAPGAGSTFDISLRAPAFRSVDLPEDVCKAPPDFTETTSEAWAA